MALAVHAVLANVVGVTEEQFQQLLDGHLLLGDEADRCDEKLGQVVDILDEHSIDYRVTKGVATSRLAYPDRTWRLYGDADLLIGEDDFLSVLGLLETAGFESRVQSPHRRRYFHAVPFFNDQSGAEVDLHRSLAMGFLGSRAPESIWFGSHVWIDVAGRRARSSDVGSLLLHACFHAVSRRPQLSTARDIVQLYTHPELSEDRFRQVLHDSDAASIVNNAVAWASATTGYPLVGRDEETSTGSWLGRITARTEADNPDALMLGTFLAQPGVRAKGEFLASALAEDSRRQTLERAQRILSRRRRS